jgi:cytoskeleton protein RodZ
MAAERPSGDFGSTLRDARERRGISLRQIANATKIPVAALDALEQNDVARLPGGIFSRAFVRSYALEVGLNPDQTIQEFVAHFPHDAGAAGPAAAAQVEESERVNSDRQMATTFLRLTALSVPVAAVLLYFGTVGWTRSFGPVEPTGVTVASVPIVPATPAVPAADAAASAPPGAPEGAVQPPPVAVAVVPAVTPASDASVELLTVKISARRVCWVSATADGVRAIDRLLQAGEEHTIDVRSELVITAGDGSAIALTLNGADALPLGKSGQVARATLNLTNYKGYLRPR